MILDFDGSPITPEVLEQIAFASRLGEDEIIIKNLAPTAFFDLIQSFYRGVVELPEGFNTKSPDEVELKPGQIVLVDGRRVQVKKIKKSPTNPAYILTHE